MIETRRLCLLDGLIVRLPYVGQPERGDPTVQLLEADDKLGAMLLERCLPGDMLRSAPEEAQDVVIAALLKRLWRRSRLLHRVQPYFSLNRFTVLRLDVSAIFQRLPLNTCGFMKSLRSSAEFRGH